MSLRRARWVNGTLIALAVALSVAAWLTAESVTTSERLAREHNVFRSWRPGELERIRIARPGQPGATLTLTRLENSSDPHDFALGEQEPRKADPGAVSELLGALEYATWIRRVDPDAVDRGNFGLQEPILEVRVTFHNTDYRLIIGGEAPAPSGARYAELTGTGVPNPGVGLLAAEAVERLQVDSRAFLGRQLLPYARSEIARIELRGEGGHRRLVRDARGFRLDDERGLRADAAATDRLFFQMARVAADEYLNVEEARRLLADAASVEVTQIPVTGDPVRVRLGGACPGSPADTIALRETDPAIAGCVPGTVLPALTTGRDDLVDRTPFPFQTDEVDHVTVVEGERVIEAVRTGSRFDLLRPRRGEVELDAGNDFLQALVATPGELRKPENTANDRAEPPIPELSPPRGTVTLRGLIESNDEPIELTVRYGAPNAEGRVWIEREDDGARLALNAHRAHAFSADDTWTRSRSVLQLDKDSIEQVEIETPDGTRVVERQANGGLRLARPEGFALDSGLAADWLTELSGLRAVRWLSPAEASHRLFEPTLDVTVTHRAGEERRRFGFRVGDRVPGGYLAELRTDADPPARFVLPASVFRTLSALPISRLTMVPEVDHIERVALEGRGVRVVLERRAGDLVAVDGVLAPESVTTLEQALAGLQPEGAIHVGPPRPGDGFDRPELIITGQLRRPGDEARAFTYRFGRVETWQGRVAQLARKDGVDATFVFDRDPIQRLLDAL